jgi:AraC-like DNA-binding protein
MDRLSHVLALSNTESTLSMELRAGGEWALACPGETHVKYGLVLAGSCWLVVEGVDAPLRLREGDCYLVTGGRPYRLASDPALAPVLADAVWAPGEQLGYCGSGHDVTVIGGRFNFDRANAELLRALPSVIHLDADSDESGVLRATMPLIAHETGIPRPGQALMLQHLAHITLMQGLRARASRDASASALTHDWPASFHDPRIEMVLTAMHGDVARSWSVSELAKIAGMSRTSFSDKFKETVGMSPAKYMLSLRMHAAKQILIKSNRTVSSVGAELGYTSEAAFSAAFKRVMGTSPRNYRDSGVGNGFEVAQ